MKTIYFRNDKKWIDPHAVLLNSGESITEEIDLNPCNTEGIYSLSFDNEKFNHLFITDGADKTGKVYPGALSIGVEYKRNEEMGRDLTYLFSPMITKTGIVENFVFEDAGNLSYRDDKSKKISVFLPESYDGRTPHGVLYFFDAQNLFCGAGEYTENGDPYGSWQLDLVITELHRQYGKNIIVVGIDNADMYRSHELFMNPDAFGELSPLATAIPDDNFSKGYLDGLSTFMVTTLHSFIKDRYCVDETDIGVGGSSMGGIAAFYSGLKEMGIYKYVLSYSPAFGLYENSAFENYFSGLAFAESADRLPGIHIYCGGGDPLEESLMPSASAMKRLLTKYGYPEMKVFETFDNEKPHNEESWRMILPESFKLLFDLRGNNG